VVLIHKKALLRKAEILFYSSAQQNKYTYFNQHNTYLEAIITVTQTNIS